MNKGKSDVIYGRNRRSLARGRIDYWAQFTEEHQWTQGYRGFCNKVEGWNNERGQMCGVEV
jgi:hypothetical protein